MLGSKANFLSPFKDSIWDLIRSELLSPNAKETEDVADHESMDEEINSMATFLTEMSDKTTTASTTTSPPGRPRKKYLDGMSDDTLSRRFGPLDDAVRVETGTILNDVVQAIADDIEKDPHLVAAWHEARLTDELKSLIGIARNLIKALDLLPATSTVRTVLIKYMSLGIKTIYSAFVYLLLYSIG